MLFIAYRHIKVGLLVVYLSVVLFSGKSPATATIYPFKEQNTLSPALQFEAPADWHYGAVVRINESVPYSWLRTDPLTGHDSVVDTAYHGDFLFVQPLIPTWNPKWDGTQWWWTVQNLKSGKKGYVEQNALALMLNSLAPASTQGPTIVYFDVNSRHPRAGSTVFVRWKFTGAPSAYIASDYFPPYRLVKTKLAPEGLLEIPVSSLYKNTDGTIHLILILTDETGVTPLLEPKGNYYYAADDILTYVSDITTDFFRANVTNANQRQTITIEWKTTLATSVSLIETEAHSQFSPYATWHTLAPTDSLEIVIPHDEFYRMEFTLLPMNANGPGAITRIEVQVNCPNKFFFEAYNWHGCAADVPQKTPAVYQTFQNGMMVGRTDKHLIYVFITHGTFSGWLFTFDDTWKGDESFNAHATPPTGLYQPMHGFGKAWLSERIHGVTPLKDILGWATGLEQSYTMTFQPLAPVNEKSDYQDIFNLPDGNVVDSISTGSNTTWVFIQQYLRQNFF